MMKNIKEYINESLFDSEDDILNRDPSEAILNWLEKNIFSIYMIKDRIKIKKGVVYHAGKLYAPYFFKANPPSWVKFDKRSWEDVLTGIKYNVNSQADISNIPGRIEGIECDFIKNIDIENSSITINDIKDIENIHLSYKDPSVVIHVNFQNGNWGGVDVTEKMLTELYSRTNHIIIDIRKSKLSGKFLRQIKKYSLDGFYDKNKNLFDQLFHNGVEYLTLGMYRDIEIFKDHIEFAK